MCCISAIRLWFVACMKTTADIWRRCCLARRRRGVTVSLDLSKPDPDSESGKVDWRSVLRRVLPYVDLFLPSVDEIAFMLGVPASPEALASELLAWGPAVLGIKLGSDGFYLQTSADSPRFDRIGRGFVGDADGWAGRRLQTPCFDVDVCGTTGAGDSTIAGFLAAFVRGLSPERAMTCAVGVGACCVEGPDALSGIPSWSSLTERIRGGWTKRESMGDANGWQWNDGLAMWQGPNDGQR